MKHLEVYGLASWIGVLGGVVTLATMLALDSMYATPSLALAVYSDFNPVDTTHKILRSADIFAAWQAVVAGIGITVLGRKEGSMGIVVAIVLWAAWVAISIALGLAR